ncbi:MAG TPA: Rossmann-like and DUF2520 domain-containing protein [Gemmatimonadaceae bacterium]|nr:Rossmann-like and DUF2520 domain-containing protein [Gemmatimonadaceae bacterium]
MSERDAERVFILGAGRAGRSLARALRASGVEIAGLHGRRASDGEDVIGVTTGSLPAALRRATVVLVTVQDAALDGALGELAAAGWTAGAGRPVVLHASGSAEPAALGALRAAGHAAGTFHPLVALAEPARGAELLRGAWIGVDGDARAVDAARRLAARLGARAVVIPDGSKPRYHAAAVFAANFPVVLAELALRLMRAGGIDAEAARGAVVSLMSGAVGNLAAATPAQALTGPVVRGDVATIRHHLDVLAADAATLACYTALSAVALQIATERGLDGDAMREIGELVRASRSASRPTVRSARSGRTPSPPSGE